jgi:hypothetical protein
MNIVHSTTNMAQTTQVFAWANGQNLAQVHLETARLASPPLLPPHHRHMQNNIVRQNWGQSAICEFEE